MSIRRDTVDWFTPTIKAGAWAFVPLVTQLGQYRLTVESWDVAGNMTTAGVFYLTLAEAPIAGLILASTAPAAHGDVVTFTATISSGTNINYTWNLGDGSQPLATG